MKTPAKLAGIAALAAAIAISATGCATPIARPAEEALLPSMVFRVPWSAYTVIPSKNYEVVGAVALRNVNGATLLADLMRPAIQMGGHDIINVRIAMTAEGEVTAATATVIRYTDETLVFEEIVEAVAIGDPVEIFHVRRLENPYVMAEAASALSGALAAAGIGRAGWSAHTVIPSKEYVVLGAIALSGVPSATLLADLMEQAIAMGGHDIINVRLAAASDGIVINAATAVVIQYTGATLMSAPGHIGVSSLPSAAPPAALAAAAPAAPAVSAQPAQAADSGRRRIWPWVLGGAGALLLGIMIF
jgi:hypothetical protein